MINVNIRYKGKELSTILPKCNDELRADTIRMMAFLLRKKLLNGGGTEVMLNEEESIHL